MTLLELNILADTELDSIIQHYKNENIFEYLSESVFGINYEDMTLILSSHSYINLYEEKLYAYSLGKEVSRDIPSYICEEFRFILKPLSQTKTIYKGSPMSLKKRILIDAEYITVQNSCMGEEANEKLANFCSLHNVYEITEEDCRLEALDINIRSSKVAVITEGFIIYVFGVIGYQDRVKFIGYVFNREIPEFSEFGSISLNSNIYGKEFFLTAYKDEFIYPDVSNWDKTKAVLNEDHPYVDLKTDALHLIANKNENTDSNIKFEVLQTGKQVPLPMKNLLSQASGERAFIAHNNGCLEVYIVMRNITKRELIELKDDLSVIYQDYEIPFLVLKYKKMSFDMPLLNLHGVAPEHNTLNIYIIDENGLILKNNRILGLNQELMHCIVKGHYQIALYPVHQVINTVQRDIYSKYSPKDMCRGGVRQRFQKAA